MEENPEDRGRKVSPAVGRLKVRQLSVDFIGDEARVRRGLPRYHLPSQQNRLKSS